MNIGIIGVGGVGGYFGGKICQSAAVLKAKVYFVARGGHLEEIRKNGLRVKTALEGEWISRPTLATDDIEELPELDVCLICAKSYDLKAVVARLQSKVSDTALILPLLNGIDIYDRIRESIGAGTVLPACAYVGTHVETYGKVTQNGGARKILFGKDPQKDIPAPGPLFELFDASRIKYEWFDDVYPEIWAKYVFIAAFGLVTAGFDKTLGQIMESIELSDYALSIMGEIVAISRKKGIGLQETIITDSYEKGHDFPYETKTSFQRDFERSDKPDERDLFGGTILRLGERFGVGTPFTREVWDILNNRKPLPL